MNAIFCTNLGVRAVKGEDLLRQLLSAIASSNLAGAWMFVLCVVQE
jgi:hypothetical protein